MKRNPGNQGKRRKPKTTVFGVVWYRPEDYETMLGLFDDREGMQDTYEEWLEDAKRSTGALKRAGLNLRKVYIYPDTFPAWCESHGLKLNAEARSRYASEAVRIAFTGAASQA